MDFLALDPYRSWADAAVKAASARGWRARRISRGEESEGACGVGFIRCSMDPAELATNRRDYAAMRQNLTMIQDQTQIDVYESKSLQLALWREWMPETWRFTDIVEALVFAETCELPIVSKADQGASSVNVRIIESRQALREHISVVFGRGIPLQRDQLQRGYVLLQRCIPHTITYRVNVIGNARAIFFRYCYPDRMVAQTGNVEPAMELNPKLHSLLDFADRFAQAAGTKWCALDILEDGSTWRLLETSEGWPWPSPGTCNEGTIFRTRRPRKWIEMFEVLCDEIEGGAWS